MKSLPRLPLLVMSALCCVTIAMLCAELAAGGRPYLRNGFRVRESAIPAEKPWPRPARLDPWETTLVDRAFEILATRSAFQRYYQTNSQTGEVVFRYNPANFPVGYEPNIRGIKSVAWRGPENAAERASEWQPRVYFQTDRNSAGEIAPVRRAGGFTISMDQVHWTFQVDANNDSPDVSVHNIITE